MASGSIPGTVTNAFNDASLEGATVTVSKTGIGQTSTTQTDREGNFSLDQLPDGTYNLTATKSGYLRERQPFAAHRGPRLRDDQEKHHPGLGTPESRRAGWRLPTEKTHLPSAGIQAFSTLTPSSKLVRDWKE